jgi:hypothetical protein
MALRAWARIHPEHGVRPELASPGTNAGARLRLGRRRRRRRHGVLRYSLAIARSRKGRGGCTADDNDNDDGSHGRPARFRSAVGLATHDERILYPKQRER